ncbi:MAG: prepilin-type N-terminal cleavage/methylation domain-containing protein [Desulfobacterales bacterium]|nr:prepilin-type N-terminal cleavage/methylation domain-containing protein [Desulfobacterales bacterium]
MNLHNSVKKDGFSMLEILVSLGISAVIMLVIFSFYTFQNTAYTARNNISEMQQNLRAAMFLMEPEIRSAGYDPTNSSGASITAANVSSITVQRDMNADGTISIGVNSEQVIYGLRKLNAGGVGNIDGDANGDGICDVPPCFIGRNISNPVTPGGGFQSVGENIDVLNFVYLDADNNVLTQPIIDLSLIRSIQVTIVARTEQRDRTFVNRAAYTNQQGTVLLPAQNDNFHRFGLTTTINCRNLYF